MSIPDRQPFPTLIESPSSDLEKPMHNSFRLPKHPLVSSKRARAALARVAFAVAALALPHLALSQAATQVLDASALHPPPGARVAIVEFSDLECPACASVNPLLMSAEQKYKIPWVRHDYLLPYHVWSPAATVYARWFESVRKGLGEDYRNQVFAHQSSIFGRQGLRDFTRNFAQSRGVSLPFEVDPQGKFMAAAIADSDLARHTGINHTPTIFIVTSGGKGQPWVEVTDNTKLFQMIDQALADTAAPARKPHRN